jgi:hypothetical protein
VCLGFAVAPVLAAPPAPVARRRRSESHRPPPIYRPARQSATLGLAHPHYNRGEHPVASRDWIDADQAVLCDTRQGRRRASKMTNTSRLSALRSRKAALGADGPLLLRGLQRQHLHVRRDRLSQAAVAAARLRAEHRAGRRRRRARAAVRAAAVAEPRRDGNARGAAPAGRRPSRLRATESFISAHRRRGSAGCRSRRGGGARSRRTPAPPATGTPRRRGRRAGRSARAAGCGWPRRRRPR